MEGMGMGVFTMVVVIVAISCGTAVISDYLKTRRAEARKAPDDQSLAELEALKQRVAVLEEIVTDNRFQLNREISSLERRA